MHRFPIHKYSKFSELPLEFFNKQKFLVYILDFNWNYLFVNAFVGENLNMDPSQLIGKNMWETFKALDSDSDFQTLRKNTENGVVSNIVTTSPITGKKLSISGYKLDDCYYFSSTVLPNKAGLINELRSQLNKFSPGP
jgi:hypothetical protein